MQTSAGVPYRIETPRLRIDCCEPAHAPAMKEAIDASLAELRPWMTWVEAHPLPLAAVTETCQHFRSTFDRSEQYPYVILDHRGAFVGGIGLHPRVGPQALELGYWLRTNRTGDGLATEAAAALTRVAFDCLGMERLEIRVAVGNIASNAIPRRLGYTHDATLRRRIPTSDGLMHDACIWSLFRDEFASSHAATYRIAATDAIGQRLL